MILMNTLMWGMMVDWQNYPVCLHFGAMDSIIEDPLGIAHISNPSFRVWGACAEVKKITGGRKRIMKIENIFVPGLCQWWGDRCFRKSILFLVGPKIFLILEKIFDFRKRFRAIFEKSKMVAGMSQMSRLSRP